MNELKHQCGYLLCALLLISACSRDVPSDALTDAGGSEGLQAPAPTPVPAPTPTVWTACAQENGVCLFDGTADVRYGLDGVYITKSATHAIGCSNADFGGDPVIGSTKTCEYANVVPQTTTDDPGWIACALENQDCVFTGNAEVRYGFHHIYFIQEATGGIHCGNQVFGDPLIGIYKKCEYRPKKLEARFWPRRAIGRW